MAAQNRMRLSDSAVLKVRDLYAETIKRGTPPHEYEMRRYSHAEIARLMDCSETTVFRVINRLGAYAWVGGQSMGETKDDPKIAAEAAASLARLQALMATPQPVEDKPEPEAQLSAETKAKADEIERRIKDGN